jgi:hypothetical protein
MDFSIFIVPVDIIESEYGKPFVCRGMIGKGPAVLRPLFDIYGRRDLLYFAGVLGALSTNCQANDDACKSLFAFLCADVLKGCKMLQVYQSDQSACALLPQISFLSSVFDSLFL